MQPLETPQQMVGGFADGPIVGGAVADDNAFSFRGFFFGGISPLLTRSCTRTHLAKLAGCATSYFNAVKSSPPFFVSVSWHSRQCESKNFRQGDGKSPAISGATAPKKRAN